MRPLVVDTLPRAARALVAAAGCLLALAASAAGPAASAAAQALRSPAPAPWAAPYTPQQAAANERAAASPLGGAPLHKNKKGDECRLCHGERIALGDNAVVENRECIECHGGYPELAERGQAKLVNKAINVHDSHLGPEVACTACHQGHRESKSYCVHCHTNFKMPMPEDVRARR